MKTVETGYRLSGTNAERLALSTTTTGQYNIVFYETDTNSEYEWKGSEWIQTSINGSMPIRTTASDVSFPEQWKFQDGVSAKTTAALFTTADVSAYTPFDTLTFTKSAAVEAATVTLQLSPGRRGVLVISGLTGETIAITGTINSVATGSVLGRISGALNTIAPMTGLGNGTHYLEF